MDRERYYVAEGRAHDYLMRCKDCQALVTYAVITKLGCCDKCGNKRFVEITLLTEAEMAKLTSGEIDFPQKDQFLAEFAGVDPSTPKEKDMEAVN